MWWLDWVAYLTRVYKDYPSACLCYASIFIFYEKDIVIKIKIHCVNSFLSFTHIDNTWSMRSCFLMYNVHKLYLCTFKDFNRGCDRIIHKLSMNIALVRFSLSNLLARFSQSATGRAERWMKRVAYIHKLTRQIQIKSN